MIDDDASMFRRFRVWAFLMPPDLREWSLDLLEEAVSRSQRRLARDRLLREAGRKIGGKDYQRVSELLRLQLWIMTPGATRQVKPDSPAALVAEALAHFPRIARRTQLKQILKDGRSCP